MGDWEEEGRRVGEERKEEAGEARREVPGGVGVGVPFPPLFHRPGEAPGWQSTASWSLFRFSVGFASFSCLLGE